MKHAFSSLSELGAAFGKKIDKTQSDNQAIRSLNALVYSTDRGRIKQTAKSTKIAKSDGFAKVRRETKGRKGKGVITISGLDLSLSELKKLASQLKKTCGSGGNVVGETIEIQGDKRDIIKSTLEQHGFKVKFIGG